LQSWARSNRGGSRNCRWPWSWRRCWRLRCTEALSFLLPLRFESALTLDLLACAILVETAQTLQFVDLDFHPPHAQLAFEGVDVHLRFEGRELGERACPDDGDRR
jgi:hypothetical protein